MESRIDDYEILKVTIPDDGLTTHQIRYKTLNNYAELPGPLGGFIGGKPVLYLVGADGSKVPLNKIGKMGEYSTYSVDGNQFTISVNIEGAKSAFWTIVGIVIVALLLIIILIFVIAGIIKRHGGKLPKFLNRIITKISEKIESKELIFYDESAGHMKKAAGAESDDFDDLDKELEDEDDTKE